MEGRARTVSGNPLPAPKLPLQQRGSSPGRQLCSYEPLGTTAPTLALHRCVRNADETISMVPLLLQLLPGPRI